MAKEQGEEVSEESQDKYFHVISEIHDFSSKYRRKPKRKRRCSLQTQDMLAIPKF